MVRRQCAPRTGNLYHPFIQHPPLPNPGYAPDDVHHIQLVYVKYMCMYKTVSKWGTHMLPLFPDMFRVALVDWRG